MRAGEVCREIGQGRVKNLDHLGGKVGARQDLGLRPLPPPPAVASLAILQLNTPRAVEATASPMTLRLHIQLNPPRVTGKAWLSLGGIYSLPAWPGAWRPLETRPQEPGRELALPPALASQPGKGPGEWHPR